MKKKDSNYYLLAIVAIVAVVGIIVMVFASMPNQKTTVALSSDAEAANTGGMARVLLDNKETSSVAVDETCICDLKGTCPNRIFTVHNMKTDFALDKCSNRGETEENCHLYYYDCKWK